MGGGGCPLPDPMNPPLIMDDSRNKKHVCTLEFFCHFCQYIKQRSEIISKDINKIVKCMVHTKKIFNQHVNKVGYEEK